MIIRMLLASLIFCLMTVADAVSGQATRETSPPQQMDETENSREENDIEMRDRQDL